MMLWRIKFILCLPIFLWHAQAAAQAFGQGMYGLYPPCPYKKKINPAYKETADVARNVSNQVQKLETEKRKLTAQQARLNSNMIDARRAIEKALDPDVAADVIKVAGAYNKSCNKFQADCPGTQPDPTAEKVTASAWCY